MAISQTPRTWRLAGLLGLAGTCLGLILGCGAATNVPQTGAMSASTTSGGSVSPPLRSWKDRVTDVQEGRATEIDAQTLAANAVHWSMLKSGCERLERLQVPELPEDAEDWQTLTALPQLRLLKILGAVRDEDLLKLAQLASLEVLNLPQGKFSDDGLKALTKLEKLEQFRLKNPRITNEGIKIIANYPALRRLHLIDIPLTDEGLESLFPLTHLESFYLDGGQCTDAGLHRLLKTLPNLHFHRDQLHLPDDPQADGH